MVSTFGLPCPVTAQTDLLVGLGVYPVFDRNTSGTGTDESGTFPVTLKQSSPTLPIVAAARGAYSLSPRASLEGVLTVASIRTSVVEERDSGAPLFPESFTGTVGTASARAVLLLSRAGSRIAFLGGLGPAVVWRSGELFEGWTGLVDIGGAAGIGARFPVGKLHLRADLDTYLYSMKLALPGTVDLDSEFRADVLLTVGISVYDLF